MLDPAPPPEGDRGGAEPVSRLRNPRGDGRAGGGAGASRRLPLGRHGRVHRRPAAQFLFPRNEHAAPGRASGDRAGHRARSRRADDAHRRRREAAVRPAGRAARRLGDRGAHLCRGPDAQFSAVDRPPRPVSAADRGRRPARRRRLRRGRDQRLLRPDDRQARRLMVADRDTAINRLRGALDEFYVAGVRHNVPFLAAVAAKPRFRAGALSTNFIAEEFPGGFVTAGRFCRGRPGDPARRGARRTPHPRARDGDRRQARRGRASKFPRNTQFCSTADPSGCRASRKAALTWSKSRARAGSRRPIGSRAKPCCMRASSSRSRQCRSNGCRARNFGSCIAALYAAPRCCRRGPPSCSALMPEKKAADTSRLLLSPMPGLLSSIAVEQGQEVKAGEPLAIVEAMKMENVLRAERDGRVAKRPRQPGRQPRRRRGDPRIRVDLLSLQHRQRA